MKVEVQDRIAPTIDELIGPEDTLLFRCVDCQSFLLPRMVHMAVFRFRDKTTGEARSLPVQICPVCYDKVGSPEYEKIRAEDMPQSYFITLTRSQYEQTKIAERWGLKYDPETDKMRSNLIVH